MATKALLALCAALSLVPADGGGAPDWVHLLPAGGTVATVDGRGPYKVGDYDALMANSLPAGEKLVLDENHATDLAAPKGMPAPARGWIVELQRRADGIWGRVEWTDEGRKLAEQGAYRGISPVIALRKDRTTIVGIRRASLVNQPNLEGLVTLHSEENDMEFRNQIIAALGLGDDATDEDIVAAIKKALGGDAVAEATQAALAPLATLLGVAVDGDLAGAITALQSEQGEPNPAEITALQSELADVTTRFNALSTSLSLQAAETFVDGAIAEGRVGVKPLRDRYIAMHQKDPTGTEELIGAMPKVGGPALQQRQTTTRSAELDDADRTVIALMGLDPDKYKETRAAELGLNEEAL